MKLDVLGLEAFVAVADHGGFGRAAEALHITQTGLTRRVQNLEEILGVRLLERTTRAVGLTASGRDFLPRGRELLAGLRAAFTELHEGGRSRRGDFTIACVPTVGVRFLAGVMSRYAAQFPENRVRILDHASVDVATAVLRREAEFGINIAGTHHPDLDAIPLLKDRFALACRRDHLLARHKSLAWRDLEGHPLVFVGRVSGNRELLDVALGEGELRLQLRYEVQRSSTAVGLAAAGLGPAIVPSLAWQEDAWPKLKLIPLRRPVVTRALTLIARRNAVLSPAAGALYQLIADRRKSRGA